MRDFYRTIGFVGPTREATRPRNCTEVFASSGPGTQYLMKRLLDEGRSS